MNDNTRTKSDGKGSNVTLSNKRQTVVENHVRPGSEGTWHIKKAKQVCNFYKINFSSLFHFVE